MVVSSVVGGYATLWWTPPNTTNFFTSPLNFRSKDKLEHHHYNKTGKEVRIIAFVDNNHFEVRDEVFELPIANDFH